MTIFTKNINVKSVMYAWKLFLKQVYEKKSVDNANLSELGVSLRIAQIKIKNRDGSAPKMPH